MTPSELWRPGFTLKELTVRYDTILLSEWDHTAILAAGIYNLTCVVVSALSKSKMRPRPPSYFNPVRPRKVEGLKITQENFSDLQMIGNLMMGG